MSRTLFVSFVVVVDVVASACSSSNARAVRDLMQSPVTPASDAIFNAVIYTNGQLVASPQTDGQWDRLRAQAQSLRASAERMKTLAPAPDAQPWLKQSDALAAASTETMKAIDARSLQGVIDGGGKIYDTCAACHAAYIKEGEP